MKKRRRPHLLRYSIALSQSMMTMSSSLIESKSRHHFDIIDDDADDRLSLLRLYVGDAAVMMMSDSSRNDNVDELDERRIVYSC